MQFRFTLIDPNGTEQRISEPGGWQDHKLVRERHPEFHTLIENIEADLAFYGRNGGEDGGADFIRRVEREHGVDAEIQLFIEVSPNGLDWQTYFEGALLLEGLQESAGMITCPIVKGGAWRKFINRFDIPVDVTSSTSIDGTPVTPLQPITVRLTCQPIRQLFSGQSVNPGIDQDPSGSTIAVITEGTYYQVSFPELTRDEVPEMYILPQVTNPQLPVPILTAKFAGTYSFEIQTLAYDYQPPYNFPAGVDISDYIRFYINIDGVETEFDIGSHFAGGGNIDGGRIYTLDLPNQELQAGSTVRVYGKAIADLTAGSPYLGQIRWNGKVTGNLSIDSVLVPNAVLESYMKITADTTYPDTEAPGFWLHDLFHAVVERITK